MNQGYRHYIDWGRGRSRPIVSPALSLEWREDWFANLCLAVVLAVVIFLMLLSIYLVVTKPEPSSNPDRKAAPFQGSSFAQASSTEPVGLVALAFRPAIPAV